MKQLIWFTILVFLISCNDEHQKRISINYFDSVEQTSIRFLDSLNLSRFNDSAKWLIYTIQCDDSSKMGRVRDSKTVSKTPLSFLKLNLTYIKQQQDTLQLLYDFIIDDTIVVEESTSKHPLINGVVFNISKNRVVGYVKGEGIYSDTGNLRSRYLYSLQPEVLDFLKANKDRLNPWLKQEALRRKIIL